MYNHEHFKDSNLVNSSEERHKNNLEESLEVEKPDMTNVPLFENMKWETPFDYSGSLRTMLDKHSIFYWHPELTADEYMRYQENEMLKYLENADPLDDDIYPSDGEYPDDY